MSAEIRHPSRRRALTEEDFYQGVRKRDVAILARALTLIESTNSSHRRLAEKLLTRLLPHTGRAIRVGITGAPGVGKSTLVEAIGLLLIGRGMRVAVLAVDPSSRISGGSILGDKTRMGRLAVEPAAYIRPSPAAGTLGGVARKTRDSLLVCEAAGYDVILVETVGVGQSESMVADMTDCFVALMFPGAGDELQGIKRGLLELVDVVVVNKADGDTRSAAEVSVQQYDTALKLLARDISHSEAPDVLMCSALHHEGVDTVWDTIERRHTRCLAAGQLDERRRQQNLRWWWAIVEERIRHALQTRTDIRELRERLEKEVGAGSTSAETAARCILAACGLDIE